MPSPLFPPNSENDETESAETRRLSKSSVEDTRAADGKPMTGVEQSVPGEDDESSGLERERSSPDDRYRDDRWDERSELEAS